MANKIGSVLFCGDIGFVKQTGQPYRSGPLKFTCKLNIKKCGLFQILCQELKSTLFADDPCYAVPNASRSASGQFQKKEIKP